MTKKKERAPIEGNDVCVMVHTALRKCCDSPITSAAYNLIHLICGMTFEPDEFDPWRLYGKVVAESITPTTSDAQLGLLCKHGVERLEEAFRQLEEKRRNSSSSGRESAPSNAREALNTLVRVFRCFDRNDWDAMASYLQEGDS